VAEEVCADDRFGIAGVQGAADALRAPLTHPTYVADDRVHHCGGCRDSDPFLDGQLRYPHRSGPEFIDRVLVEVEDGDGGDPAILRSDRPDAAWWN
jgi:hypothetical protein